MDSPAFVVLNDRASRVARHAEMLARAGREDPEGVEELRRLAGRSRYALTDALKNFRRNDLHLEWRHYNHSVRLLEAAIAKTAVAPEDSRSTERLNELQRLAGLDPAKAFEELARREPGLMALRDKVAAVPARPWPQSKEGLRELARNGRQIHDQLLPLAGRQRADQDPILATETAVAICGGYLRRLVYPDRPPRTARRRE
ncbi:MAG TPA: hypothetical protein VHZ96_22805 [Frankiaceae bacterium]|nr:hypothetical protein [Frankiaceae bacterium]